MVQNNLPVMALHQGRKRLSRRGQKPEFRPVGVGVETAEPARALHEDMKLSNREKKQKKARRAKSAENGGWRSMFAFGALARLVVTLLLFGGMLHGLFVFFGIYDLNDQLSKAAHLVLIIKLVVFLTLMHLFYVMLMHYRPIRHRVRSVFFLALAPVAAVCIFMIYGGGQLFGKFVPVLQFLTLTIGVVGFLLYVLVYTWLSGKQVRREERKVRQQDPESNKGGSVFRQSAGGVDLKDSNSGSTVRGGASGGGRPRVQLPEI